MLETSGVKKPLWKRPRRLRFQRNIRRWGRQYWYVWASVLFFALMGAAVLQHYQNKYEALVDARLGSGSLRANSSIYAAPRMIRPGHAMTPVQLVGHLQRAGYTDQRNNPVGYYRWTPEGVEITTGPESYFQPQSVAIQFKGQKIKSIIPQSQQKPADQYWLEPELITNVFGEGRGKRRPVAFSEFPKHLVEAVISVEDKRFFEHGGLDLLRVAKAAYVDLKEGRKEQGASTLTMQLARSFWLDQDKNWKRKFAEVIIASELEDRFSKEEIFQLYGNEIYLGRSGSFSIHGFGEAARAYFGKDVRKLSLPEAAMLAGIIQRPSYFNPFRFPDRVKQRRDVVLTLMRNNGYIEDQQFAEATKTAIKLNPAEIESTDAPYFVDLANTDLRSQFQKWDFTQNAYRIYSTLDLDLQRIAVEAIRDTMPNVDKAARRAGGKEVEGKTPQVALVALDPHTGAIKALIGGRDYSKSQLNRALARRPPGSTFKPFVYAAALNGALEDNHALITAGTSVMDEPTTFLFKNEVYEPANYGGSYNGPVTVRRALVKSLNIPTIKIAEKAGFETVVDVATQAGISTPLKPTPSLALGAYEVPPLELAEAYTIFANGGVRQKRHWMQLIRDEKNKVVFRNKPEPTQVLDQRVAYILTDMMEDVIRAGTASGVRARGFTVPAAGKTGTAHDGWFAGFTNNLLAVVWIGYDDYTELGLEGSKSALLVWTEFMKRAHELKLYADPKPFEAPDGIARIAIDADTGLLASSECYNVRTEVFVYGTQPRDYCNDDYHDFYEDAVAQVEMIGYPQQERSRSVLGKVLDIFR